MMKFLRPAPQTMLASTGLLVLRLFCGYAFMVHGWGKIQKPFSWMPPEMGYPGILLALAALAEFGGGLAWILGLLTPVASFGLACTMTVAAWFHVVISKQGMVATGPGPSGEPAMVYLCVAIALLLVGPGRFSVDAVLFREKKT